MATLPPSCAVVMKFENLDFLEPSEPLQACNGIAILFYIYILSGTFICTLDFQIPFVPFLFVVAMLTFLLIIILLIMHQATPCCLY
jgi:hypothetical protein